VGIFATALLSAAESVEAAEPEALANPILPVGNEMFWGALCFCALWALMKFVLLPPVLRGMEARDEKVRSDLEASDAAALEAKVKMTEYEESLSSAKADAVRTMEAARNAAEADRQQVLAGVESEVSARKAEAAAEVATAKDAARGQLRESVADIAVAAAGAVVQKPLDRDSQLQAIEDYVNRAGSQN
jgi:F-type H+-transporting ATPase subunit b